MGDKEWRNARRDPSTNNRSATRTQAPPGLSRARAARVRAAYTEQGTVTTEQGIVMTMTCAPGGTPVLRAGRAGQPSRRASPRGLEPKEEGGGARARSVLVRRLYDAQPARPPPQYKRVLEYFSRYGIR